MKKICGNFNILNFKILKEIMPQEKNNISERKKDHIDICLSDEVSFREKTTGFKNYDFIHDALTEVLLEEIDLSLNFLNKKITYPFFSKSPVF